MAHDPDTPDATPASDVPAGDDAAETVRLLRARAAALRGELVDDPAGDPADDPTGDPGREPPPTSGAGALRPPTGDRPGADRPAGEDANGEEVAPPIEAGRRTLDEADLTAGPDDVLPDDDVDLDEAEARLSRLRSRGIDRASVVATIVLVAVMAASFFGARALFAPGDGPAGDRTVEDAEAGGPSTTEAPDLEEITADVTLPPGPEDGLAVVETGITIVEDRFDPVRREGTYALIIENPNDDQLAQAVQVDVDFVDSTGAVVGTDTAFVEVVLPGQRVAVASLLFDAPTEAVVGLDVTLDVARWRNITDVGGAFLISDVATVEADFSGVETTFVVQSSFDEDLRDVVVTAVYRRADGSIIGGADTFVEFLGSGAPTPAAVSLLANVSVEDVAATELYPAASFGFVPGDPIG